MTIRLLIDNPAAAAPRPAAIDASDSPSRWDEGLNGPDFFVSPRGEVFEWLHFDLAAANEQRWTSYDSDDCLQTSEADLRDTDRLQLMPPGIGSVEDLLPAQTKTRRVNSILQHRLCRSPKHSRSRRANTLKPVHCLFAHLWLPWVVMRPVICPGHRKQQASADPIRVPLRVLEGTSKKSGYLSWAEYERHYRVALSSLTCGWLSARVAFKRFRPDTCRASQPCVENSLHRCLRPLP